MTSLTDLTGMVINLVSSNEYGDEREDDVLAEFVLGYVKSV
jgi:hypothetical protein